VRDEVLDLLASGFTKNFDSAEVGSVRLDQGGVKLMLTNKLAEVVANCSPAIVAVGGLRREFL
jgi:hypothetical protein